MRQEIMNWWEQANADLLVAKDNLQKHPYVTAFFSQQAVEKGLKALYLLKFQKSAPKTHDLTALCDNLKVPERLRIIAENLTPSYTFSRYPDVAKTIPAKFYSVEHASTLLTKATEALQWIRKELSL